MEDLDFLDWLDPLDPPAAARADPAPLDHQARAATPAPRDRKAETASTASKDSEDLKGRSEGWACPAPPARRAHPARRA